MTAISSSRSIEADQIVSAALSLVADVGLGGLTMRDLAQSFGKSTTVIVNLFGAKAGLIEAVAQAAFDQDEAWHRAFFEDAASLALGRDGLVAIASQYLRERAGASAGFVRVWEALILDQASSDHPPSLLRRWEAMRADQWAGFLAASGLGEFGPVLSTALIIEQFYAGALTGRADYEAIAAEGLGGLIDHALGRRDDAAPATQSYMAQLVIPQAPADDLEPGAIKLRLLDVAADQIQSNGVGFVTNRSVSTTVGTSTSTIAYHWSDMRRFIVDAIWHAVFREMPGYLDYRHASDDGPPDLAAWSERIAQTLLVANVHETDGFYVKYARLIAQVCLEARRDPSFRPLAMILRGPEGGGTYVNRAARWPAELELSRLAATRFALWIKGAALVGAASGEPLSAASVRHAAITLVANRQG